MVQSLRFWKRKKSFLTHPQTTQFFGPEIIAVVGFSCVLPEAFYIESAGRWDTLFYYLLCLLVIILEIIPYQYIKSCHFLCWTRKPFFKTMNWQVAFEISLKEEKILSPKINVCFIRTLVLLKLLIIILLM